MTKCVQFPISQSMPWIMTDFLINTPAMKENIYFPMDIYNDAASHALYTLKQQVSSTHTAHFLFFIFAFSFPFQPHVLMI